MNIVSRIKESLPARPFEPPNHAPGRSILLAMAVIICVPVIVHFNIASPLVAFFTLAIYVTKLTLIVLRKSHLPKSVTIITAVISAVLVLATYGGWSGQRAGLSFLVLLLALKFLESTSLRDYYIISILLYFICAASFLFFNTPIAIFFIIAYTGMVTILLFRLTNPFMESWLTPSKEAFFVIIKTLPLAILLFFFFPRIQGDFGFLPDQEQRNDSQELENTLNAGEFANSAFNESLAFRVEFDGPIPPRNERYWRSKVMTIEDNFNWNVKPRAQRSLRNLKREQQDNAQYTPRYTYSVLHEPSRDHFLPYLDYVLETSNGFNLNDYSVYRLDPLPIAFTYTGSSVTRPIISKPPASLDLLLRTKSQPSAKMQALMLQWQRQAANPKQLVELVYAYFKSQPFRYSLTPPSLTDNRFDDFMFNTQTGYCEHYASAYTLIMRWLGIPARIVVGYQGGEMNQSGNFMQLRYSDAHAWSEVWLDNQWIRVDPTAAVSPERIDYGMDAFMSLFKDGNLGNSSALADFLQPSGFDKFWRGLKDSYTNLGYQWNKWVLDYDFDKQKELLAKLGLQSKNPLTALVTLLIGGSALLLLFYIWQLLPKSRQYDTATQQYRVFLNKLKRQKFIKNKNETPLDFAHRAAKAFPDSALEIHSITEQYLQLHYGRQPENKNKSLVDDFKSTIRQFNLRQSEVAHETT